MNRVEYNKNYILAKLFVQALAARVRLPVVALADAARLFLGPLPVILV